MKKPYVTQRAYKRAKEEYDKYTSTDTPSERQEYNMARSKEVLDTLQEIFELQQQPLIENPNYKRQYSIEAITIICNLLDKVDSTGAVLSLNKLSEAYIKIAEADTSLPQLKRTSCVQFLCGVMYAIIQKEELFEIEPPEEKLCSPVQELIQENLALKHIVGNICKYLNVPLEQLQALDYTPAPLTLPEPLDMETFTEKDEEVFQAFKEKISSLPVGAKTIIKRFEALEMKKLGIHPSCKFTELFSITNNYIDKHNTGGDLEFLFVSNLYFADKYHSRKSKQYVNISESKIKDNKHLKQAYYAHFDTALNICYNITNGKKTLTQEFRTYLYMR